MASYICYCLKNEKGLKTYVGCTNNFTRRIRQHNSEISGGAKFTTKQSKLGFFWKPILFAKGFIDNHEALSFEWHWKYVTRKYCKNIINNPFEKRLKALNILLQKDRFSHIYKEIIF